MIFTKRLKKDGELLYDFEKQEQDRLYQYITILNKEIIIGDMEIILILSMSQNYTYTPHKSFEELSINKELSSDYHHIGNMMGKKIYQDYSGKLKKYEFLGFNSMSEMKSKMIFNNRKEKIMKIIEQKKEEYRKED